MKIVLVNQFTPRIIFDKNKNFNVEEHVKSQVPVNVNFDISITYKKNPNVDTEYLLELRLLWNDINSPIIIDMVTCGIFKIEGDFDDISLDKELKIRGAENVFPFMRERILNITSQGGIAPILMPPISFEEIYEKNKNRPTIQ
jgi:preprotein translocase subunit SecB